MDLTANYSNNHNQHDIPTRELNTFPDKDLKLWGLLDPVQPRSEIVVITPLKIIANSPSYYGKRVIGT